MVQVGGFDRGPEDLPELCQGPEKGGRVGAPRKRRDDPVAGLESDGLAEEPFDLVEEAVLRGENGDPLVRLAKIWKWWR